MLDIRSPEMCFALKAVRTACLLVKAVQEEMAVPALTKKDRSPVTVADFAVQAVVAKMLEEAFPGADLVGEEGSGDLTSGDGSRVLAQVVAFVQRTMPNAEPGEVVSWIDKGGAVPGKSYWTLDPVDGTKGFLRGEQYAVALAYVVEGVVQLGVLGCPNLGLGDANLISPDGVLLAAVRGYGAWANSSITGEDFKRLQVSGVSDPSRARILRSYESGHTNVDQIDSFADDLGVKADPLRLDSQAKYGLLAAGKGDLLVRFLSTEQPDYREKIWDQAAGSIIVEEAGGTVTDLDGKPLDFTAGRRLLNNRGLLASNGSLHPVALSSLKRIKA